MSVYLSILLGVLIGGVVVGMAWSISSSMKAITRSVSDLKHKVGIQETEIYSLQKQVDEFEIASSRMRHTGVTMAGLEDAEAFLHELRLKRKHEEVLLEASLNTLKEMRQGPYNYNPDKTYIERLKETGDKT